MAAHDALTALAILAGLAGIVVVVLPGLALIVLAVVIWSLIEGGIAGLVVGALALVMGAATLWLKYQRPGRRLAAAGVPTRHLVVAATAGVIGLFVIPVLGAPLFFVAAIYLQAVASKGRAAAWPATRTALRAVLASVGIELAGGAAIAFVWLVGVIVS